MATRDEVLEIAVGANWIQGTLIVPDTRLPGVLFLHGWGGNQLQYAPRARDIAALGCACLTVDLRGHAKTEPDRPRVTREDNLQDAIAAYDRLVAEPAVDRKRIAVVGSSYGGYLATILTKLRPISWLALRAPALYRDSEWDLPKLALRKAQDLDAYRRTTVAVQDNRALGAAAAYQGDVLIIESSADTVIPREVIENYRRAFVLAKSMAHRVIEGGDHALADPVGRETYTTLLVNWISEMIAGKRADDLPSQKRLQDVTTTQAAV